MPERYTNSSGVSFGSQRARPDGASPRSSNHFSADFEPNADGTDPALGAGTQRHPPTIFSLAGSTMKNISLASLSLVSVIALGAGGCVHAATMEVPNPVVSKQVPSNSIQFPNGYAESAHGLPTGTLTDEAALLSVDDNQICFKLTLRSDGARADLAKPAGWRVFLRGKPEFEDMAPQITEDGDVEESTMQGFEDLSSATQQQICDDQGHCYNRSITTSTRVPADIKVVKGSSKVCFVNKGHLTATTEEITLHLDDNSPQLAQAGGNRGGMFGAWGGGGQRVAFRWKFD
jgi:hypothetical protein